MLWMMIAGFLLTAMNISASEPVKRDFSITPVPFTDVNINDSFWSPRLETNRKVTVPYCFDMSEETGRIDNFRKAAGQMEGAFKGIRFDDSDVFKVMEGAAYTLTLHQDPKLRKYLDELIATVAAAQEPDGYLYTARTIKQATPIRDTGDERWSFLKESHELYNIGHMYEAAVAHYQATGDPAFLNVALKSADLADEVFGPEKKRDVPGHEEIEIGLVKLYRITGDEKYLRLAKFFIDERGHAHGRELYGENRQDHIPVIEQTEPVGHAVRAGYLYTAMADVAALTGDEEYIAALDRIWDNMVGKRIYITGGIGARRHGESFGENYELPNDSAYNETCAAIANALWNHRMFLLHGDAKYMDVFERTVYNGFLVGISLKGDTFFYPNPLYCDGHDKFNQGSVTRSPWFDCSCCPVNIVRFLPSLAGYMYAQQEDNIFVNLYAAGKSQIDLHDNSVRIEQRTKYPWDGHITLSVDPDRNGDAFTLRLRVPGWVNEGPMPSDLYRFLDENSEEVVLMVNNERVPLEIEKGYAVLRRNWQRGDRVELILPMPVRRVLSHEKVEANQGRVALIRGPIVYCLEAVDNKGRVSDIAIADDAQFSFRRTSKLGGIVEIHGDALRIERDEERIKSVEKATFTAIPYYAWNHRKIGEMSVWVHRAEERHYDQGEGTSTLRR